MIPQSQSRIYLFDIRYKDSDEIDEGTIDQVVAALNKKFIDLGFNDVTGILSYKNNKISSEIHINKLIYKNQRIFNKEESDLIRLKVMECLTFVKDLQVGQLHFVNDMFEKNMEF